MHVAPEPVRNAWMPRRSRLAHRLWGLAGLVLESQQTTRNQIAILSSLVARKAWNFPFGRGAKGGNLYEGVCF
jgi:hypothetical protein